MKRSLGLATTVTLIGCEVESEPCRSNVALALFLSNSNTMYLRMQGISPVHMDSGDV
jgi:hypothetical protein